MRRASLKPDEEARNSLGVGCSGFGLRAIYLDLDSQRWMVAEFLNFRK